METTDINGHTVKYDASDDRHTGHAVRYLKNRSSSNWEENEEIFREAKSAGSGTHGAEFKDDQGATFYLKMGDSSYTLKYRGW